MRARAFNVLVRFAIAVGGVASIVATGGGMGASCGFSCAPDLGDLPNLLHYTSVDPLQHTVQVGLPATFTATTSLDQPSYRWCRLESAGTECVVLSQVTGATYTIPAVTMADDGARFSVTATGYQGTKASAYSTLYVSSLPAVVFEDGEFIDAEWTVASKVDPAQGGPAFGVVRVPTGGRPNAYRSVTNDFTAASGIVRVFHDRLAATYDLGSQGAIRHLDFSLSCRTTPLPTGLSVAAMVEQAGRRYRSTRIAGGCSQLFWVDIAHASIRPEEFEWVDGPACAAGEPCPDFSDKGPPLRFGVQTTAARPPADATRAGMDLDNWKVTIWRR